MSLGLGDLKKKQTKTAQAERVTKTAEAASVAKPWTTEDLSARPRTKGKKDVADIAMNDESSSLQAAPLFFMELASDSRLAKVEDALLKIEERVVRALDRPLKAAQQIFPKFFAQ